MGYEKKTWKNRQSEYPNRRTLTPVDGQENTYDVARAEGLVMEEGDAFDQQAMNDLEERIESGLVDSGVNVYTHTKSGTVHEFTGQGANGRALMTADVSSGDTITVNGEPVTAYMGTDNATESMAGSPYTGKWVTFVVEDGVLNFKGGGGKVTVSGLSANVVKKGTTVTVKQGANVIASVAGILLDYNSAVIGMGRGRSQRHTCYAPFVKTSESGAFWGSGNAVMVRDAGEYIAICFTTARYNFGSFTSNLAITQPGESTINISGGTSQNSYYWWRGRLKAGSGLTLSMTNTYSGSSEALQNCDLAIIRLA